jgi:hypothetical protein
LVPAACFLVARSGRGEPTPDAAGRGPTPAASDAAESTPAPSPSEATADARSRWTERFDQARQELLDGKFEGAQSAFLELAGEATTDSDRRLAVEMALLSASWSERKQRALLERGSPVVRAEARTRDEITLLYTTSFIYGAGSGAWFLLQVQPSTALTATLPFIAITAAPVIAVAVVDGHKPLPQGVPHAIAAGAYLGLGEGILVVSYQHARAHRLDSGSAESSRWKPEEVATVLWTGATAGALLGGTAAYGLGTTPGRVSFTASTSTWSGVLTGFISGAALSEGAHRTEQSLLTAMVGYNVGLVGGLLTAASVSPSVARTRLVDLSGLAGGFAAGGLYLGFAHGHSNERVFLATTSAGAAAGLVGGWILTRGMGRETSSGSPAGVTITPTIQPVAGGMTLGVAGTLY